MRTLLALLLVPGAGAGTAVGNPTGLTIDTAPGAGLTFDSGVADVASIVVTDRKGVAWTLAVDGPFDLLGGTRVEVPLADASSVRVVFDGPLVLHAEGPDDRDVSLALTVPSLEVAIAAPPGEVPDAVLRLGAPGWISSVLAGAFVDADDPVHDALVRALTAGTALYPDLDGDGRCGDGAAPADDEDDDDDLDDGPDDDAAEGADDHDDDDEDGASECDDLPLGTVAR